MTTLNAEVNNDSMLLRAVSEGWQGLLVVTQGGTFVVLWQLLSPASQPDIAAFDRALPDGEMIILKAKLWSDNLVWTHGSCRFWRWPFLSMATRPPTPKLNNHDLVPSKALADGNGRSACRRQSECETGGATGKFERKRSQGGVIEAPQTRRWDSVERKRKIWFAACSCRS